MADVLQMSKTFLRFWQNWFDKSQPNVWVWKWDFVVFIKSTHSHHSPACRPGAGWLQRTVSVDLSFSKLKREFSDMLHVENTNMNRITQINPLYLVLVLCLWYLHPSLQNSNLPSCLKSSGAHWSLWTGGTVTKTTQQKSEIRPNTDERSWW